MWLLSATWGAIGLFDLLKAEFLPERVQRYTVIRLLNFISWHTWIIVFLVLLIGVLLEGGHAAIQRRNKSLPPIANGPDVVLDWESGGQKFDRVRLRNIGKESAFNVTLNSFSWPELSFTAPLQINAIHPNDSEVIREPKFFEKLPSGVSNIGRLDVDLRSPLYRNHQPLEVMMTFSDTHGTMFERKFVLEAGHGGSWGPEVVVTPKEIKRKAGGAPLT